MKEEELLAEIKRIEKEHAIKIWYAVESGSRAWGFPSPDSDYDIRFIYTRPLEWYLSINQGRDVVEEPIDELLDISGWDLQKTLPLLMKSNPSIVEWLASPIIYLEEAQFATELRDWLASHLTKRNLFYHYLNMAKNNYHRHLTGETVNLKKYFYVLRPILACRYLEKFTTVPPILFNELVAKGELSQAIRKEIEELLIKKLASNELASAPSNPILNEFIEEQLSHFERLVETLPKERTDTQVEVLNQLFRRYVRLT